MGKGITGGALLDGGIEDSLNATLYPVGIPHWDVSPGAADGWCLCLSKIDTLYIGNQRATRRPTWNLEACLL